MGLLDHAEGVPLWEDPIGGVARRRVRSGQDCGRRIRALVSGGRVPRRSQGSACPRAQEGAFLTDQPKPEDPTSVPSAAQHLLRDRSRICGWLEHWSPLVPGVIAVGASGGNVLSCVAATF